MIITEDHFFAFQGNTSWIQNPPRSALTSYTQLTASCYTGFMYNCSSYISPDLKACMTVLELILFCLKNWKMRDRINKHSVSKSQMYSHVTKIRNHYTYLFTSLLAEHRNVFITQPIPLIQNHSKKLNKTMKKEIRYTDISLDWKPYITFFFNYFVFTS